MATRTTIRSDEEIQRDVLEELGWEPGSSRTRSASRSGTAW